MKKLLFSVLFFGVFQITQAQNVTTNTNQTEDNSIHNISGIEVKPEFPGGVQAFYKFIAANYRSPDVAGLQGKIFVSFVVDKDGSLTDIKAVRDIGYGTGLEAVRVFSLSPKWKPAMQNGEAVRCSYLIPITINVTK